MPAPIRLNHVEDHNQKSWLQQNIYYVIAFVTIVFSLVIAYFLKTHPAMAIRTLNDEVPQPLLPQGGNPYQNAKLQKPSAEQNPQHENDLPKIDGKPIYERNAGGGYTIVNPHLQQEVNAYDALRAGDMQLFQNIFRALPVIWQGHLGQQIRNLPEFQQIIAANPNIFNLQQQPQIRPR